MRTQRTHFTNLKWVEERGVGYEGEGEVGGVGEGTLRERSGCQPSLR